MATSSIPAAIDYLVTQTRALPECAAPVVVFDGWPMGRAEVGVVIGITPEDPETGVEPVHAELGAQVEWEVYDVPCIVWAHAGGGEEAMKAARDAAFAILNAIMTKVRQDRALGGALHSGAAAVRRIRVEQTGTADAAGEGRSCEIRFDINCRNRF